MTNAHVAFVVADIRVLENATALLRSAVCQIRAASVPGQGNAVLMPRMMSPTGELGQVPDDQVQAAQEAGFKVMNDDTMQTMYNRLFLAQKFFEQKHPTVRNWRLPRGRGKW